MQPFKYECNEYNICNSNSYNSFFFFFADLSSQVRIHPEPIYPPADAREIERAPDMPHHPAQGQGYHLPHGLLFKENDVYVPVNYRFWAAITSDNWILGKCSNNTIQPIYNQNLKMVKVNIYTQRVVELSRREIRDIGFHQHHSGINK